jgi:hypothetical protein
MNKFYKSVATYATDSQTALLAQHIDPAQKGNESRFKEVLSKYKVSLANVGRLARMIGAPSKHQS